MIMTVGKITSSFASLHWADILVFSLALLFSLLIGAYYGWKSRRRHELHDYLLGGPRLPLSPVALSLFVTFQSGVSVIGVPAEMYMYGTMYALQALGICLSLLLCCSTVVPMMYHLRLTSVYEYLEMRYKSKAVRMFGTLLGMLQMTIYLGLTLYTPALSLYTGVSVIGIPAEMYMYGTMYALQALGLCLSLLLCCSTVVPMMYHLQLTSVYEYLEMRYKSKAVRMFGTLLGMLQMTIYLGLTLYTPALSLYTVAGIPLWLSIVAIGIIGTVYTTLGGMRSVIWTEVYQCLVILTGLLAVIVKGSKAVGFAKIGSSVNVGRRIVFDNAYLLYIPMILLYTAFLSFIGLLMYTYYNVVRCDPLESGILGNLNQLMLYFVFDLLQDIPGLSGLFICTIFSGALSILTSGINALSTNTVIDLLGARLENTRKISATLAAKIAVVFYGVLIIGLSYVMGHAGGPLTQISLSIFGTFGGPLVGLFFLGGLFPQANWIGGMTGTVISLILNTWISVGAQIYGKKTTALPPNPIDGCYLNITTITPTVETATLQPTSHLDVPTFSFYDVSYFWYGLMGFLMTIIIGLITSFALKTLAPSCVDGM